MNLVFQNLYEVNCGNLISRNRGQMSIFGDLKSHKNSIGNKFKEISTKERENSEYEVNRDMNPEINSFKRKCSSDSSFPYERMSDESPVMFTKGINTISWYSIKQINNEDRNSENNLPPGFISRSSSKSEYDIYETIPHTKTPLLCDNSLRNNFNKCDSENKLKKPFADNTLKVTIKPPTSHSDIFPNSLNTTNSYPSNSSAIYGKTSSEEIEPSKSV